MLDRLSDAELDRLEGLIADREAGEWSDLSELLESDRLFMASIGSGEAE